MYGICEYVNELVVFFSLRIQTDVKIHLATWVVADTTV